MVCDWQEHRDRVYSSFSTKNIVVDHVPCAAKCIFSSCWCYQVVSGSLDMGKTKVKHRRGLLFHQYSFSNHSVDVDGREGSIEDTTD